MKLRQKRAHILNTAKLSNYFKNSELYDLKQWLNNTSTEPYLIHTVYNALLEAESYNNGGELLFYYSQTYSGRSSFFVKKEAKYLCFNGKVFLKLVTCA